MLLRDGHGVVAYKMVKPLLQTLIPIAQGLNPRLWAPLPTTTVLTVFTDRPIC